MTIVVAEIGVNWDGNYELAKEMMINAKECGCNSVKFQALQEKQVAEHPERSRIMKSSISKDNIDEINRIAKQVGIDWFCTPMYRDAIDLLEPYVKQFKIREKDGSLLAENHSNDLLDAVLKTGKKIYVSSRKSPKNSAYFDEKRIFWLYCVPKYPSKLDDLNFSDFDDFRGYSNHCPDIVAPLTAAILGAEIIEIHITSEKSNDFLDNPVSFDYSELKTLTNFLVRAEKIKK